MENAKSMFARYQATTGLDIVKELVPKERFEGYKVYEDEDEFYEACELGEGGFFDDLWKAITSKVEQICLDVWEYYNKEYEQTLLDVIFIQVVADMPNILKYFDVVVVEG